MLIVCSLMLSPLYLAMGQTEDFWSFAAVCLFACLLFGAMIALISILTGLFSGKDERGRVLGVIGMTAALGAVIGGFCIGPIVDRWGYTTMFTVVGLSFLIPSLVGIFLEDKKIKTVVKSTVSKPKGKFNFGKPFFILLSAHLIAYIVFGIGNLGRSMAMNNLDFTAASITSTATVAGFISLPFPFLLGWLSDRLGRKRLLIICYTSFVLCMIAFAVSKSLWHFWIAAGLLRIGNVGKDVGAAYITDLVNQESLGRGMSLFQGMFWIGQMIGYTVAGVEFEKLGIETALFLSAMLSVISIILMIFIRVEKQQKHVTA
jgi:MFS family permease